MEIFIGSFIIFIISSLALGLGMLFLGKPLHGRCSPQGESCEHACAKRVCPNKTKRRENIPEV
jgi:hypothetical protein